MALNQLVSWAAIASLQTVSWTSQRHNSTMAKGRREFVRPPRHQERPTGHGRSMESGGVSAEPRPTHEKEKEGP